MKTFLTTLKACLITNGMSDTQADAVIQEMLEGEQDSAMRGRWNDDPEYYPDMMLNVLEQTCARYALGYIDRECPQAWFRPCFLPPAEQAAFLASLKTEEQLKLSGLNQKP